MNQPSKSHPIHRLPSLLEAFLQNAPFAGMNDAALKAAAREIVLSEGALEIIAPDGAISMIDYWFSKADEVMESELSIRKGLKIREKATFAVRSRLEFFGQNKEALRRAIVQLALPQNAARALAIGYRMADKAWRAFGDTSTDFNYYSKRTMLLGVDVATSAFFLGDESTEHQNTWAFLDRRIENIMQIEKAKAGFRKAKEKLPDIIPLLAKLRYGAKPLI